MSRKKVLNLTELDKAVAYSFGDGWADWSMGSSLTPSLARPPTA
ncbi:hypothetical protein [Sodalinema gerasimenkoae]|nr:hypothetical protein [Sodalinema gerasimenkoae]